MDKIKELLVKAGCKQELTDKICESLNSYKKTIKEQFEAEYSAKIEQAKKVCIEETEAHKRELSKRLQIFCETKSAAIEAQLAKQSALNESEAEARLDSIKNILGGMMPNSQPNGKIEAALQKAKKIAHVASEDKKRAVELANKQTAIAERALRKNRELTNTNSRLQKLVEESRNPGKARRIDESRPRSGRPVSTRATLVENQDRRPPQQPPRTANGGIGIADVAAAMDEDLV